MFELIFLGTSASSPSPHRGLSGHLLMYRNHRFIIDCGEGTQRQILISGMGFKRLNKILLTHSHLDHILGIGGLVSTLARWEANMDAIEIYGGRSTIVRVRELLNRIVLRGNPTAVEIRYVEISDGDVLMEDDHFVVTAFKVEHRGPGCFGFVFEEKARRPFLADIATTLGVPNGPERRELTQGKSITLADGTIVTPDDVLGEEIAGIKYVHIGDVGKTEGLAKIIDGATALTIEATYTSADADMATQFGHMTAERSAQLAKDANVDTLILTHLSRRYFERDIRSEAKEVFPKTIVARDFDHVTIAKNKVVRHNLQKKARAKTAD